MIETLLPEGVRASEAFGPDGAAVLYPEEAALVAAATEGRREEFTTVRGCARRAMAALGLPGGTAFTLPGPGPGGPAGSAVPAPGVVDGADAAAEGES
ncbi:hypothetical protein ACWD0G_31795, partial [Streptomyces goshikiensis]